MTIAERLVAVRRIGAHHRRLLAIATVGVLVVVGSTTAVAVSAQAAAVEQARADAIAAQELEQKFVDYYVGALDRLQPFGTQLVDDATAWATSGSPLLTADDVAALQSTADAVSESLARTPRVHATSAELEELWNSQWAMITGARERFGYLVDRALAAAKAHLDAAPIADAASRQAVVDAMDALGSAEWDHAPLTPSFTALTGAVAAVDTAQAAAVAAAAAAAAASVKRGGVAPRPGSAAAAGSPAPVCASDVLTCVNQIRVYYGLGALSSNGTLNANAQSCAQRMHDEGAMTHTPMTAPPPGFRAWGENIAYGYGSQVSVFNAWMNSSGHRANILRPSFTSMGLGYVASGNWWCQQFGG